MKLKIKFDVIKLLVDEKNRSKNTLLLCSKIHKLVENVYDYWNINMPKAAQKSNSTAGAIQVWQICRDSLVIICILKY